MRMSASEMLDRMTTAVQQNPNGFRAAKTKRIYASRPKPTLMEQLSNAAYGMKPEPHMSRRTMAKVLNHHDRMAARESDRHSAASYE